MRIDKIDLRGKLFLFSLLIDIAILLLVGLYLEGRLHDRLTHSISQQLHRNADIASYVLARVLEGPTFQQVDPWAEALGDAMQIRLTIIDPQGVVRGDSTVPLEQVSFLENHLSRQEVQEAINSSEGISKRYSSTVGEPQLYLARIFTLFEVQWIVRVSISMQEVHDAVQQQRNILITAGILALLPGILITAILSNLLTRRLRELVQRARVLIESLVPGMNYPTHSDSVDGLAWSIERMACNLEHLFFELAEDRSRVETVLQSLTEGVLALNTERCVILINDSAMRLLGIAHPPPIGRFVEEILPPACLEHVQAFWHIQEGCPMEEMMVTEQQTRLLMCGTFLKKSGGCVLVFRDITERQRIINMQREFVANVSHELRTPVHAILIHAELLTERLAGMVADPPSHAMARFLEKNALRLSRIIDDVLYLSRLDAGKESATLKPLCLLELVTATLETVERLFLDKAMELEVRIAPHTYLLADARMLVRVVSNLLDNAAQHCPPHSRILLDARREADHTIRVEIMDNGPGIQLEHHPRLFERFYRVDWDRNRDTGGTGLGLSIAKHLVEQMQGAIGVEPVLPHGCLFWFTLRQA